ncbi:D-2-hydroxyacid dehydrogenase [Arthrobacter wenxiniae]|uniref:D-2-hydroxyacid dehydrogenase n=1 Tax=Arthrobacter wenxiniae TaxID=2713570 RepID=A0A7Y7LZD0_9MICC|nr:D-2-hydroxyacid dehydrogenase [Arthrobacter wenxiniae]NVM95857.1 D-2-hydroxyacid dehydrogenase [Arthrobacter wenxiniae]
MMNTMTHNNLTAAIAVPLEAGHVESIRSAHPAVTVRYEPELLPPERFPADHAGDPVFRRTPEQESRYWDMLRGADVLYGFPNESAAGLAEIAASGKVQWIQAMAAGAGGAVKAANLPEAQLRRIAVTSSAGVHGLPLAEFAMMGVLNGFKRSAEMAADQSAKHWPELRTPTRLVSGSTAVITGLGEIGMETARLARAMGMRVSGTKRTIEPVDGVDTVTDTAGLPGLLANADALINTLPGTPYTEKMINAEIFAAMKPGTVLVNVGRGTVVDEDALLEALDSGQVSYACLDVFAVEPLPASSPLWEHPRVMVSPHTSALSVAENRLIAERFIENLTRFQAGEPLLHVVDPVHFY